MSKGVSRRTLPVSSEGMGRDWAHGELVNQWSRHECATRAVCGQGEADVTSWLFSNQLSTAPVSSARHSFTPLLLLFPNSMPSCRLALLLLLSLPLLVYGTALTYNVAAHEKACFFTWADAPGKKVAFYFAVQSGGSFDIDYTVTDPRNRVIINGERERQGDYVFTANDVGEYSFCFANDMSTFAEKLVDFEISVENEARPVAIKEPAGGQQPEALSFMEESLFRLSGSLSNIARTQKYFRTRENRNFSTVVSTENRIFWFAITESIAIVAMAGLQVYVVRNFFNFKKGHV
ncbi:emp24/gp25L/p24 family/GOLD-domain-containing protein [Endogone sp. FLAS-F59071]|nr:emp24/gp25L/p24 family/GOLD-domain-containing protein [Endogone sp. FLAS-F59071]|eukprot:RUS23160.1 emp24/gp25L/p24 family/GOLD-domain-containing protein [Endogone sp. FLAS-F59071]